jgi:hypothetical protein
MHDAGIKPYGQPATDYKGKDKEGGYRSKLVLLKRELYSKLPLYLSNFGLNPVLIDSFIRG